MVNSYVLIGYGVFLAILLVINLLYFFQVFKYRLPGDASLVVLFIHMALVLGILIFSTTYLAGVI